MVLFAAKLCYCVEDWIYSVVASPEQKDAKFDPNLAFEAFDWIQDVLGEPLTISPDTPGDVEKALKDGVVLCK